MTAMPKNKAKTRDFFVIVVKKQQKISL